MKSYDFAMNIRTISELRQELHDSKGEHDRRLRSLRQEHEKVKTRYEDRIRALEAAIKAAAVTTVGTAASMGGKGATSSSQGSGQVQYRTLTAATVRIRELEVEVERIRSFYTKKVWCNCLKCNNNMKK